MQTLFLDQTKIDQPQVIRTALKNSSLTWKSFAAKIGVNKSMLFFYLHNKCRIPKSRIERMVKDGFLSSQYIEDWLYVEGEDYKEREIQLLKIDEDFCYFAGILFGDGCISTKYSVIITSNRLLENSFSNNVVKPLITNLFGITSSTCIQRNTIHQKLYSKELVSFLTKNLGLPIGKKKNKMHVPQQIKENHILARAFVRGLFDTDGGLFRHHKTLAQLQLCSLSPDFLQEVCELLTSLGFKNYVSGKNLYMCDSEMIDKFFEEIKPVNDRITRKYEIYKQTGIVPLQREMKPLEQKSLA